jgi:hypothetical protein
LDGIAKAWLQSAESKVDEEQKAKFRTKYAASADAKANANAGSNAGSNATAGADESASASASRPKKTSAFILFSINRRAAIKAENPDFSFGEIGREIGKQWKELKEAEKAVWKEKADTARNEAAKEWAESGGSGSGKKGKRKRQSRVMEIDGETVLKVNNYAMDDDSGLSVFDHEV